MIVSAIPHWQPSLLDSLTAPQVDEGYSTLTRTDLDQTAWIEYAPRWISGSDVLFADLLHGLDWGQRTRHMYDRRVLEPRLTFAWRADSGEPLAFPVLERMRAALSLRYGRDFDSVGFNLYRDGGDSVSWHADKIPEEIEDPVVALVSVGEPRTFLLRPKGGRAAKKLLLGRGDLLVTGGATQRTWEHSVPKVVQAGPRISIAFRHGPSTKAHRVPGKLGEVRERLTSDRRANH